MFKNRDIASGDFRDHLIFNDRVFAITGYDFSEAADIGVSFGINNAGLAVCSSTVLINDCAPYDILLEDILKEADSIAEAVRIVSEALNAGEEYQWCNFVIGTLDEIGVIEVSSDEYRLERDDQYVIRTNHHLLLSTKEFVQKASPEQREACGPLDASHYRRQVASKKVAGATTFQDISAMLSIHSESRGFDSICRHRDGIVASEHKLGETVYSYILEVLMLDGKTPEVSIQVAKGNPCSNTFKQFDVNFDSTKEEKQSIIDRFP